MNYTVVLRHSDRSRIQNPKEAMNARITFRGYFRAFKGGLFLRRNFDDIDRVHTAYELRCYRTAQAMRLAWNPLGCPGIRRESSQHDFFGAGYVKEDSLRLWLQNTDECNPGISVRPRSFHERFKSWERRGLLRLGLDDYAQEFLARFLVGSNLLIISHSTNIGPLMEFLAKKYGFENAPLFSNPNVLSGFCIQHGDGSPGAIYWIEMANEIRQLWRAQQPVKPSIITLQSQI